MNLKTRYYAGANGCNGYKTFFDEYTMDFCTNIALKNTSPKCRDILFAKFAAYLDELMYNYDVILSPNERDAVCGITVSDAKLSIAAAECYENLPVLNHISYDLADCEDESYVNLKHRRQSEISGMFSHLNAAKIIHDEWEDIYISNTDFSALDRAADDLSAVLFDSATSEKKEGKNTNRFFGTMLAEGNQNLIEELTADLKQRIFIKGRPGTGKSTLLKKIARTAQNIGLDTETYYCSFDTNSLDMVAVRELSVCIFDSTAPHEMFPSREGDSIFDLYALAVKGDTDEKYSKELNDINVRYNKEMTAARENLVTAQSYKDLCSGLSDVKHEPVESVINDIKNNYISKRDKT